MEWRIFFVERLFGTAGQKEDVSVLFNPLLHVTLKSINVKDMNRVTGCQKSVWSPKLLQKYRGGWVKSGETYMKSKVWSKCY